MDDLEAIHRLKSGDIGGLEILITRYQDKAVRTAYLVTHAQPIAEEVVQETFIRFYKRIHHFDEQRPFKPYFFRMVLNAALNEIKKEKRVSTSLNDDADLQGLEHLLSEASTVEDLVEYRELRDEIHRAIGDLPPRQRLAAIQRYYLNMSETEMSEAMSISAGTVKWLLNAARTRLRMMLSSSRRLE